MITKPRAALIGFLSCITAIPAAAQSPWSGALEAGQALFCAHDKSTTTVNGKPSRTRTGLKSTRTLITAVTAVHCSDQKCEKFSHSPSLSQKTQIYVADNGSTLTTNIIALDFDGSLEIKSNTGGATSLVVLSGACRELTDVEILKLGKILRKK